MKANLIRRTAIAICILSCISIYSCKKDNSASQDNTTANLSATADDQQQVSNESDIISDEVNGLINVHQLICDATITYDTANNQRVITIVYDGTNCWGNRTRSGKVIISLPLGQHWKDAGATANVVIDELKITRLRDGKSIVINGNKT